MGSQQAHRIDWSVHIANWREGKLTRTEYCKQHDLNFHTFVYQVKCHRRAASIPLTLVPVKVQAPPALSSLVLRGPKGWSLTLGADVSPSWLADLLGRL